MNDDHRAAASACLEGAEANTISFPEIVRTLMEAGFEGYAIDFRRATATYYRVEGECLELPTHRVHAAVAPIFDSTRLQSAIREAQQQVPGYTYKGFCEKAVSAGCASYVVSFSGRRALYIGRTAETHIEHFPNERH